MGLTERRRQRVQSGTPLGVQREGGWIGWVAGWHSALRQNRLAGEDTSQQCLGGLGIQSSRQDHVDCEGSLELHPRSLEESEEMDLRRTMGLGEENLVMNCVFVCGPGLVLVVI
jgi:hypothetical protein